MGYSPQCFDFALVLLSTRLENVACPSISRQQEKYLQFLQLLLSARALAIIHNIV